MSTIIIRYQRGYCTPDQFCDCLCNFLKNCSTLVTSKISFLIGNIPRNLITALEFHELKWLLIYGSKHRKYWFSHFFYCSFTTVDFTEVKLWVFEFLGIFLTRFIGYFAQSCFIFLRKCTKSLKIRPKGAVPLNVKLFNTHYLYTVFGVFLLDAQQSHCMTFYFLLLK